MRKTNRKIVFVGILILVLLVVFGGNRIFKLGEDEKNMDEKVLIIGLDGMDYRITKQLIDDGKIPNFAKLYFSKLDTSYPPQTPVAWTSIATGENPGEHNIFDFIRRDVGSYIPKLSLADYDGEKYKSYVKAETFWQVLSENGINTDVIRWPMAFPPEKVSGKMLSGLGVPDVKGLLSGYTYYTSEIVEEDNKNVVVELNDGKIETFVRGPNVQKDGKLEGVKSNMGIEFSGNKAEISIGGKSYSLSKGEWSDWIKAEFKIGIFKKVSGMFKAYLIDTEPFKMYITAMQIDPKKPVWDISYPSKFSSELVEEIGDYYTLGMPEETDGYVDDKIDASGFLKQVGQIEDERYKMFWKGFEDFQKNGGMYSIVFDSSDRVQHVFWEHSYLNNPNGRIKISKEVEDYWIEKDKFLGEVMDKLDDRTTLLIMSDHGFSSFEEGVSVNTFFVKNGLMTQTKGLSEDNALFNGVDWSKSKAYSLGFNSIYINLKGREKNGIVSLEDKEEVENEIITKLENLKDSQGRRAINKVYKASEIYSGSSLENAPDLIIGFNPGFRMAWQTAVGGFSKEVIIKNEKKWWGDHLVDPKFVPGVLFSNKKLNSDEVSQLDIAPTIYKIFGIDKGNLTGKILI